MKGLHTIRIAVENVILRHELEILTEKAQKQGLPAPVTLALSNALFLHYAQRCREIYERYREDEPASAPTSESAIILMDGSSVDNQPFEQLEQLISEIQKSFHQPNLGAS